MQQPSVSWSRQTLGNLYANAFDPDDYLRTYYGSLDSEVEFFLHNLHDFFAKLAEQSWPSCCSRQEEQRPERRVLEVGSGPTVTSIISASGWAESIICSDFLEGNRKKISHWLTTAAGEGQGPDVWEPFFQYVARLEHAACRAWSSPPIDASRLRQRVRQSVRAVVPCDVFQRPPLINSCRDGDAADGKTDPFDIVITTLCLEFASASMEDYRTAVRNVASLLRPAGYLIMQGALGNTHYWHNGRLFPSVRLSRTCVEQALLGAGCSLQTWKQLERSCPPEDKPADHTACFCCVARKDLI